MPRNVILPADKERLINAHRRGEDYYVIAQALGIARGTAYNIIRRFNRTGVVFRPRGGANNRKVNQEMIQVIIQIVEDHPEFTLTQINQELRLRCPPPVPLISESTVAKVLDAQLITLKQIRDVPAQRNSEPTKNLRRNYANWFLQNGQIEKVYIDESGFRLWSKRSYGRAPQGQPVVRVVDARNSGHYSTIFAVSNVHGLIHHDFKEGGYRHEDFNEFLSVCSQILAGRPIMFIFDNAPTHRSHEMVHLQDGHQAMFQPPYSPFLNICEGCFSIWKAQFKRHMAEIRHQLLNETHQRRSAIMMQMATQSIAAVTLPKVVELFNHSMHLLPNCVRGEDIQHA